jgi:signal transduction histidine kinase
MLTWLLAWSGGVQNPLSSGYAFHVVLGALLNGRRGALFSAGASVLALLALWSLDLFGIGPVPPLHDPPALLWAIALLTLIVGLAYLSLVTAGRMARERARAQEKQEDSERALRLLLEMLTALRVGVDVQDERGRTMLQNESNLAQSPPAQAAIARAKAALAGQVDADASPRVVERFSIPPSAGSPSTERVFEVVGLRPSHPRVAHAFLTVDRTDSLLVEQRHVMLERFATLGRAMQGVAHELNTPLTTMQTLAKDLRAALDEIELPAAVRADVGESVSLLIEEARRCRALTQSLLSTANDSARRRGLSSDLLDVVRRAAKLVGAREGDVELDEERLAAAGEVDADRALQILMNLVQNALAATSATVAAPRVTITATVDTDHVKVRVRDSGPGLPAEVKARLFEPFVTTKAEGTGLGLYTSQQLARELGGSLELGPAAGGGTEALLILPRR